jgi:hypothetical protein
MASRPPRSSEPIVPARHHPFQAGLPCGGQHVLAVPREVRGHMQYRPGEAQFAEQFRPLVVRQGDRGRAVEGEHVEHVVLDRHGHEEACRRAAHMHALLQDGEVGDTGLPDCDYLAVEYRVPPAQQFSRGGQFRIVAGDVAPVAAVGANLATARLDDRADTVPFELVRPAGAGWDRPRGGQHRLHIPIVAAISGQDG